MSNTKRNFRRRLSEAQNHRCCYCGCMMGDDPRHPQGATVEHYQAQAHGGKTTYDNCVAACRTCNEKRGTAHPKKFFASLKRGFWSPISEMAQA